MLMPEGGAMTRWLAQHGDAGAKAVDDLNR
jgi:hypothetical protein